VLIAGARSPASYRLSAAGGAPHATVVDLHSDPFGWLARVDSSSDVSTAGAASTVHCCRSMQMADVAGLAATIAANLGGGGGSGAGGAAAKAGGGHEAGDASEGEEEGAAGAGAGAGGGGSAAHAGKGHRSGLWGYAPKAGPCYRSIAVCSEYTVDSYTHAAASSLAWPINP